MAEAKLVATVWLYRYPDGRLVAVGRPEDRDQAELQGQGENAEQALQEAGRDYDRAPPGDPETVKM